MTEQISRIKDEFNRPPVDREALAGLRLAAAVLNQAIHDANLPTHTGDRYVNHANMRHRSSARAWFNGPPDYLCSFAMVCKDLGLDMEATRKRALNPVPKEPIELKPSRIAFALRSYRKQLGLAQRALAKRLGISQSRLSDWERGYYPVPENWREKINRFMSQQKPVMSRESSVMSRQS